MRRGLGRHNRRSAGGPLASLSLNFLLSTTLDPRVTFSRASSATYVDAAGILRTTASNVPRFDYSPTSIGTPLGLLVEGQATNILTNALLNGTNLSNQTPTVTATAYTLSFYGTGSIAMTGAYTGTATGTGAYPSRKTLTFTPSAGALAMVVTGTVQYAQLETGSVATSFIPTAGTSATRAVDQTSIPNSGWFNVTQGTVVVSYDTILGASNLSVIYLGTSSGGTPHIARIAGSLYGAVYAVGVTPNTGGTFPGTNKTAFSYTTSNMSATTNGGTIQTRSGATSVSNNTPTTLGYDSAGINYLYGHIKSFKFYPVAYSGTILQGL